MEILKIGNVDKGYGEEGIILENIFSVEKVDDAFIIREECDGWYCKTLDKEDLLKMIDELKKWIE